MRYKIQNLRSVIVVLTTCAMVSTSQPAFATDQMELVACAKLEAVMLQLDTQLAIWQKFGHASRLSLIRLNSKITLARAYAEDVDWPEPFVATLTSMGIVGLDSANPPLGEDEIPTFMLAQALSLSETLEEKCPETEFVDISRFADQTGG